jgi:uncharacterized protein YneF (UPF0154 family)
MDDDKLGRISTYLYLIWLTLMAILGVLGGHFLAVRQIPHP